MFPFGRRNTRPTPERMNIPDHLTVQAESKDLQAKTPAVPAPIAKKLPPPPESKSKMKIVYPPPGADWQHPLLRSLKPCYTTIYTPSSTSSTLIARLDPLCSRAFITHSTLVTHFPSLKIRTAIPTVSGTSDSLVNHRFVVDLPLVFVDEEDEEVEVLVKECVVNENRMMDRKIIWEWDFGDGGEGWRWILPGEK